MGNKTSERELTREEKNGIMELPERFNVNSVNTVRSVRRAIRRGNMSIYGTIYPRRVSNNRKRTPGRQLQEEMLKFLISTRKIRNMKEVEYKPTYMDELFQKAWDKYYPEEGIKLY